MISNYILVALRSLKKNKLYSIINILGLTLGITACLLIGLYIWQETHYDAFHINKDRTMRVTMEYGNAGNVNKTAYTGTKVGPEFARNFPEIESFTRTIIGTRIIANGDKAFTEKNVLFADSAFFNIFSFRLLKGNPENCLDAPEKIVITEEMAKKYFGNEDAFGKTLKLGNTKDYVISGIVSSVPGNSQIHFDFVIPFINLSAAKQEEQWFTANYVTYLLLKEINQIEILQKKISQHLDDVSKKELFTDGSGYLTHHLEPLTSVHLHSSLDGLEPNGNIVYIYVLGIIACLIMLIAGVNYSNLATALSAGRATEVGIRKVMGATRSQLWKRFIGESFMTSLISLLLGIILTVLLLPYFNQIANASISLSLLFNPLAILLMIILTIVISLFAGAYPAFILSGAKLGNALKSGFRISTAGGTIRRSMIVFQFVVSVFLIIATIIVVAQLSYVRNKNLGYDKDHIVILPVDTKIKNGYEDFKQALALQPGVSAVSGSYESPTFIKWTDGITAETGKEKREISVNAIPADFDFTKVMGMKLIVGRDFNQADLLEMDTSNLGENYQYSFILNESAVAALGWTPENAIGQKINKGNAGTIRGVVKDFHFTSLHQAIGPLIIFLNPDMVQEIYLKTNSGNMKQTLSGIEKIWKERVPGRSFEYRFLDEDYNNLYKSEERTAQIFTLFAGQAILLACLGLFALSAFTTVQRTKEIGIRKVLGATIPQLMILLSREFLLLVGIAIIIAIPISWLAGNRWLADFAYRISITSWMFAIASGIALLIAFVAVSLQTIKAAKANPVKSLRAE
jgi:putative ABC transport system permease protein